ncbi:hypothetical protein PHMEG_0003050 [Phytophthora megakarya]|uniref:Uncharacterized protein n=1 Tax=Phytophthora megakarya TaxID=4795 RepID=A0A225WX71_9STRA|nr:hypothetical protein PHMEG_0003050 [Phytophthora megakarya]
MMYLYTNASTSTDYQDAFLLCLLYKSISTDAGNVFFIRFIRVKTSEEQALSSLTKTLPRACYWLLRSP